VNGNAPNARRVSVVGDFCGWDGRLLPMRALGSSGIFELFVPGVEPGALYKYEIRTRGGELRLKSDPVGFAMEPPPGSASRVVASSHAWTRNVRPSNVASCCRWRGRFDHAAMRRIGQCSA
jgi:1,4-alpha-glucan branching enzyme